MRQAACMAKVQASTSVSSLPVLNPVRRLAFGHHRKVACQLLVSPFEGVPGKRRAKPEDATAAAHGIMDLGRAQTHLRG